MILIVGIDRAEALADILRAADIPAIVRQDDDIGEEELTMAEAAVARTAARLKNMRDDLTVYTFGGKDKPPFSDGHADDPAELITMLRSDTNGLFFSCGAAIDMHRATAEYKGSTVKFSKSEMRIIKCIRASALPVSAELTAECCFGSGNTRAVMSHVWKINKKFGSLTSERLIIRKAEGGYRIR